MSICDDDECCMVDNDHGNVCKNVCLCAMVICKEINVTPDPGCHYCSVQAGCHGLTLT